MSLTRLAMRLAAGRALLNRTLAGVRVFDSAVDPIDQTIAESRQPILVLTTDEHEVVTTGRDLGSGNHQCDLVIEVAIASRVEVPASDGSGGQITIAIPHTDEGMELTLDLMEHQVVCVLNRDDNDWSRAWMKLVPRVTRRLSRRGASAENGVRFAARQLVLTCDLVDTPTRGSTIEPDTAWGDVLAAMETDEALQPIAGLLRANRGRVQVEGRDVSLTPAAERARLVALLMQSDNVTARLSVEDLVGFGRWPHHQGRPGNRDRQVVAEAIAQFDLGDLSQRQIDSLSGGQRQRAFVAMAWAQEAPWLLLDEPLAALDPRHVRDLMERLRAMSRPGVAGARSIIIVMHDLAATARYADRIIALKDGRIITSGPRNLAMTGALLSDLFDTGLDVVKLRGADVVVPA